MPAINWKRMQPTSLMHSLRLCKDFARDRHNRSVERVADLMGVSADLLYKWLGTGRMPANLIPVYEHACGCYFVTIWLAHSAHKLVVDIPTGRNATATEVSELYQQFADVVGNLAKFYEGKADAQETLNQVTSLMAGLAWHHGNVEKHLQPEFEFGGEA
jgi:hypothetical protein